MPKQVKAMGALEVARLKKVGLTAVGTVAGLHLSISLSGAKSWLLRTTIAGKRKDVGLGAYPATTLADAWGKARAVKTQVEAGVDPVAQRKQATALAKNVRTFTECSTAYVDLHKAGWKNAKHAAQWATTLETYAHPHIGAKDVGDITSEDVLVCLEPIWISKNETASRLRGRIESVLAWAGVKGWRDKTHNPATWKNNLEYALPASSKVVKVKPHASMPYSQVPQFWQALSSKKGQAAQCLQLVILTATRSGEARGCRWSELDIEGRVWVIPAERMKALKEHRIPLSDQVLALLANVGRYASDPDLVFPTLVSAPELDRPISDMSMTQLLRGMGTEVTAHGFRSSFSTWTAEQTSVAFEVREACLAHTSADKVSAAYMRGDFFDKRQQHMQAWADYVSTSA